MADIKILFVCLGNICRSPLARALFNRHAADAGLNERIWSDSAGTSGYHEGENADPRTISNARGHGIILEHRARPFKPEDFDRFDHILAMDRSNMTHLSQLAQNSSHQMKIKLMRDFDPLDPGSEVPDPWYGGDEGFEEVFAILNRSTAQLLQTLQKKL